MRGREALAILLLSIGCASKAKPDSAAAPEPMASAAPAEAGPSDGAGAAPEPALEDEEADAPMREDVVEASLDDLRSELDGYETQLRERGVKLRGYPPGSKRDQHAKRPKKKTASTPATVTPERNECREVCDLATAVCGLRDRICGLASVHQSEERYEEACERAERDCERASEACDDCS